MILVEEYNGQGDCCNQGMVEEKQVYPVTIIKESMDRGLIHFRGSSKEIGISSTLSRYKLKEISLTNRIYFMVYRKSYQGGIFKCQTMKTKRC
ncbi:hypothetical protein SAMN05444672_103233 [Bacillus sp. OK838]|nr:hypothetical protein SAMN05444672_103233 [Bacillus sp. OK838]